MNRSVSTASLALLTAGFAWLLVGCAGTSDIGFAKAHTLRTSSFGGAEEDARSSSTGGYGSVGSNVIELSNGRGKYKIIASGSIASHEFPRGPVTYKTDAGDLVFPKEESPPAGSRHSLEEISRGFSRGNTLPARKPTAVPLESKSDSKPSPEPQPVPAGR